MIVNDGFDVGTGSVDFCMNESLRVQRASLCIDSITVEVQFDQIRRRHKLRSQRSRQDEAIGIPVVPGAHVSKPVENALLAEDAISSDEILDECRICGTRR